MKPLFLILSFVVPALAGAPGLPFSAVADRVRRQNPDLAAARLRLGEAQGRLRQSGRLSNPELEFDYTRNTSAAREHTLGVALTQRFPLTARLRYEKAVSRAQLANAEAEIRDVERKLIAQAETAAVKLLALQSQHDLRTKQLANSREQAAFLRKRVETGEASPVDAMQVELEARQIESEQLQLTVEEAALLGDLRPLLGFTGDQPLTLTGTLSAPQNTAASGTTGNRPDVQAAGHAVEAARAGLARERASRMEDIGVGVSYERDRAEDAPEGLRTDQMLGVKVSIPLPLWNNNAGRIQEAEAASARAQQEAAAIRLRAEAEVSAARGEMKALARLIDDLGTQLLPKAAELEEQLRQTNAAGQAPLIEVLRARDRRLQLERQRLDALRDYHLARVRFTAASGQKLR